MFHSILAVGFSLLSKFLDDRFINVLKYPVQH
jgi:hypothetical protein